MKKLTLPMLGIMISALSVFGASPGLSEAGGAAAYLKMGVGARAIGMGEAFVGVAEGGISSFWNPAGLSQMKRPELSAMHADLNLDRKYEFLNFAAPANEKMTWGVSWIHSSIDGIERRAGASDAGYAPGDLMGFFDDRENSISGSIAYKSTDKVSLGASLKYLSHDLYTNDADGVGIDLGLLFKANEDFSVGLAVKEIGSSLKWNTASNRKDDVPVNATVGFKYTPLQNVTMALDINKIEDMNTRVNFGVEGVFNEALALRAGVHDGDLTAGLGLALKDWNLDYAFAEQEIGDIHRISGSVKFGVTGEDKKSPEKLKAEVRNKTVKKARTKRKSGKKTAKMVKKAVVSCKTIDGSNKISTTGGVKKSTASMAEKNVITEPSKTAAPPSDIEKLYELGDKAILARDFGKAEEIYKKIIAITPNSADPYFKLGNLFVVKKNLEAAKEYYKLGMTIDPENRLAKYARAILETHESGSSSK